MQEAIRTERTRDVEHRDPESLDDLFLDAPDMEQALRGQEAIQARLAGMEARMERLHQGLTRFGEIQSTLDLANQELGRLGDLHWQQHIIAPMVQQVFPIFDLVIGFRTARKDKTSEEMKALKAVQAMLLDFLGTYGIALIRPTRGKAFDPALMQAVRVVSTTRKEENHCVRSCVQVGFQWNRGAAIRPASVHVWRWQSTGTAASMSSQA